jgi:hypothetical protein
MFIRKIREVLDGGKDASPDVKAELDHVGSNARSHR